MYGKTGRAGLVLLQARQYHANGSDVLTPYLVKWLRWLLVLFLRILPTQFPTRTLVYLSIRVVHRRVRKCFWACNCGVLFHPSLRMPRFFRYQCHTKYWLNRSSWTRWSTKWWPCWRSGSWTLGQICWLALHASFRGEWCESDVGYFSVSGQVLLPASGVAHNWMFRLDQP